MLRCAQRFSSLAPVVVELALRQVVYIWNSGRRIGSWGGKSLRNIGCFQRGIFVLLLSDYGVKRLCLISFLRGALGQVSVGSDGSDKWKFLYAAVSMAQRNCSGIEFQRQPINVVNMRWLFVVRLLCKIHFLNLFGSNQIVGLAKFEMFGKNTTTAGQSTPSVFQLRNRRLHVNGTTPNC